MTAPDGDGPRRQPSRWRRPRAGGVTLLLLLVVSVLFGGPVIATVLGAFRTSSPGDPGDFTTAPFRGVYGSSDTYVTLVHTVAFAVAVSVVATVIAFVCAWLVTRTDVPARRLLTPVMAIMLATPPLFFALSWNMLGGSRGSVLLWAGNHISGVPVITFDIQSWPGIVWVTSLKLTSFVYFIVLGAVRAIDTAQEEAAFVGGAGRLATLVHVTVPALRPAMIGGLLLAAIAALESFDIPLVLGTGKGITVFSTQIYYDVNNFTPPAYNRAFCLSLLLILVIVGLVWLRQRILRGRSFETVTGKNYRREPWRMGVYRWPLALMVVIFALIALVLPTIQLVVGSVQPIFGVFGHFTLDNYRASLNDSSQALWNSLLLGLAGGLITMIFATVLALVGGRRRSSRLGRLVLSSTWLPWALPGVVLGLGIYAVFLYIPGLRSLYGSTWILLVGVVILAIPVAARAVEGAVAQLSSELEDAARISGAGRIRTIFAIVLPLLAPSFVAGWFLSAVLIAGNLSVTILLSLPTTPSVPYTALGLYNSGNQSQAAALVILLMLLMACLFLASLLLRGLLVLAGVVLRSYRRRPGAHVTDAQLPVEAALASEKTSESEPTPRR